MSLTARLHLPHQHWTFPLFSFPFPSFLLPSILFLPPPIPLLASSSHLSFLFSLPSPCLSPPLPCSPLVLTSPFVSLRSSSLPSLLLPLSFYLFWFQGHTQQCLGLPLAPGLRDHSWQAPCSRGNMACWGLNLYLPSLRQVPSLLYHSLQLLLLFSLLSLLFPLLQGFLLIVCSGIIPGCFQSSIYNARNQSKVDLFFFLS